MKEGAVNVVEGSGEGSSKELVPLQGDDESSLRIVVGHSFMLQGAQAD
jgi:hypothetical protein